LLLLQPNNSIKGWGSVARKQIGHQAEEDSQNRLRGGPPASAHQRPKGRRRRQPVADQPIRESSDQDNSITFVGRQIGGSSDNFVL